jgi:peroxiredoxin
MKRRGLVFLFCLLFTVFVANPAAATRDEFAVGAKLENFSLTATDGKTYSFNDLKGKNGAVIVFLSAQCPVVKGYVERINQVAADYKAKGINFIGINSNSTESLEWVTSDAAQYFASFPMLIDKGNVLADKLGATVTPEAYYFDANSVLQYHGAIDNDRSGKNIQEQYLRTAFDAALSGKKIEKTRANAFGCTIKRAAGAN